MQSSSAGQVGTIRVDQRALLHGAETLLRVQGVVSTAAGAVSVVLGGIEDGIASAAVRDCLGLPVAVLQRSQRPIEQAAQDLINATIGAADVYTGTDQIHAPAGRFGAGSAA